MASVTLASEPPPRVRTSLDDRPAAAPKTKSTVAVAAFADVSEGRRIRASLDSKKTVIVGAGRQGRRYIRISLSDGPSALRAFAPAVPRPSPSAVFGEPPAARVIRRSLDDTTTTEVQRRPGAKLQQPPVGTQRRVRTTLD